MEALIIDELFENHEEEFKKHLEIEKNNRIVFSGLYGIGKTTFLKEFFNEREDYNTIHLFPINYSVLNNEDIFRYIKYDIFYNLIIEHKYKFTASHFSFLETAPHFIRKNLVKIFANFLLIIPKMGRQLFQLYKELNEVKESFLKYNEEVNENDLDLVQQYIDSFHNDEGGLYEDNVITKIIFDALNNLKEGRKKNILIIDDLDRLDPNHVFRLFNIFAAQIDRRDGIEKFGFDKVIFVCDIENIKGIFEHRYGVNVDFYGYIDKFFSYKIYYYNNFKSIIKIAANIFSKTQAELINELRDSSFNDLFEETKTIFIKLIEDLCKANAINLRSFLRNRYTDWRVPIKKIQFRGNKPIDSWHFSPIFLLDLFLEQFGSVEQMIDSFQKAEQYHEKEQTDEVFKKLIATICAIKNINDHNIFRRSDQKFTYIYKDNSRIRYNTQRRSLPGSKKVIFEANLLEIHSGSHKITNLNHINVFTMMLDLIKELKKLNYY